MKEFRIILEEREIDDDLEPISRKTVANQYISSPIEDDEYYEYAIKQMCQDTIDKFIEQKDEMPSIPVKSINDYNLKLVKEVCEKIRDMAHKVGKLEFCEHCHAINPARAINEHLLNEILGQIESEFEQKEYKK